MASIDYSELELKELNYNSYLRLPELLDLQKSISNPEHHDEMFFIVIHQTAELWFKEILHETCFLMEGFRKPLVSRALKALRRIRAIMNLQVEQIRLLSTLTPVEFAGFRDLLKPASGFQSAQYRMIEFTYGIRNPFFLKFFEQLPDIANTLREIQGRPSVYDECMACLHRSGYKVPDEVLNRDVSKPWELNREVVNLIQGIYEKPEDDYHWVLLFESMTDLDEAFTLWRKTHAVMVHRTIGDKMGTGGSMGFNFLKQREDLQAFPELWEVRNHIGGSH